MPTSEAVPGRATATVTSTRDGAPLRIAVGVHDPRSGIGEYRATARATRPDQG
ncbi:hypothetical protein [Kitasatospora sp. NPDC057015]|uniref:hypothetical protein n=1 Tax=Kitasatospora sp. NPDC057015 TaxID=3346001 RepID=UPI003641DC98